MMAKNDWNRFEFKLSLRGELIKARICGLLLFLPTEWFLISVKASWRQMQLWGNINRLPPSLSDLLFLIWKYMQIT